MATATNLARVVGHGCCSRSVERHVSAYSRARIALPDAYDLCAVVIKAEYVSA